MNLLNEQVRHWKISVSPTLDVIDVKKGDVAVLPRLISGSVDADEADRKLLGGDSTRRVMTVLNHTGAVESRIISVDDTQAQRIAEREIKIEPSDTISMGVHAGATSVTRDAGSITRQSRIAGNAGPKPQKGFATLSYKEGGRKKTYTMVTRELAVGRRDESNQSYVQLQIDTPTDVSREHFRIRFNKAERSFEIKDVSRFGTWVNKHQVESSLPNENGVPEGPDREHWSPLPHEATINLAGVLDITFKSHFST